MDLINILPDYIEGDWPLLCIMAMLGLFHRPFLLIQQLASCQELNGQQISLNEWSSYRYIQRTSSGKIDKIMQNYRL